MQAGDQARRFENCDLAEQVDPAAAAARAFQIRQTTNPTIAKRRRDERSLQTGGPSDQPPSASLSMKANAKVLAGAHDRQGT